MDKDRSKELEQVGSELIDKFVDRVKKDTSLYDSEARALYQYVADIFARAAVELDKSLRESARDDDEFPQVEMHGSYWYTCDNCGKDNWQREMIMSMTRNEQTDVARDAGYLREDEELEDNAHVTCTRMPRVVCCGFCNTEYVTIYDRQSMVMMLQDESEESGDGN